MFKEHLLNNIKSLSRPSSAQARKPSSTKQKKPWNAYKCSTYLFEAKYKTLVIEGAEKYVKVNVATKTIDDERVMLFQYLQ